MDLTTILTPKRKTALLDFALCALLGWCGAHKLKQRKTGMFVLYLLTFGLFGFGWLVDSVICLIAVIKGEPVQRKEASRTSGRKELSPTDPLPVIVGDSIIMLAPGEKCHYCEQATYIKTKNVVVGYEGGSNGVSVRVAKGVSYRVGATKSSPVRGDVQEKYPGVLSITSKRIVFSADKGAFDKSIDLLSAITPYGDAISFQFGSSQYSLATNESLYIYQIVKRIAESQS